VGELNLTLMEYYDRTLFELSIELEGYNRRWEEEWRKVRKPYALHFNINAEKGKKKREHELIPLPSEAEHIAWQRKIGGMKDEMKLKEATKERGDGSGINS